MKNHLRMTVPCLLAAAALALAATAGAQETPPPVTPRAAKSPQAAPMAGHHKEGAGSAMHHADMKAECQTMMARKEEMQAKHREMDATLDKLVAEMNAARGSREAGAMEKPMAAVINELVAQRKAHGSMMMEMQPSMMGHMMRHQDKTGAKGAMGCPMMSSGRLDAKDVRGGAEDKAVYTCPMHSEVQKRESGKCPKCSMNLEKKPV